MQDQPSFTDRAAEIGRQHGKSAASWIFDGNTPTETYRRVLEGIEIGDPLVMDAYRVPDLSGEFADDYSERDLAADLTTDECRDQGHDATDHDEWDDAANAYSDAASSAFWDELERVAREHAEGERIDALRSAGFQVSYLDTASVSESGFAPYYSHYYHDAPADGRRAYVNLSSIARGEDTAGQTTTLARSNYRRLTEDYPDVWTPVSYANVDALGAFIDQLTAEVIEILTGLGAEYPVYDDDDMSALEGQEIDDSWEQYVKYDIRSEIPDDARDAWDELEDDEQERVFWEAVEVSDSYPEHNGLEVLWRYDAIVRVIATRIASDES